MRLIALFNLKPGISASDYEAWRKAPTCPRSTPALDQRLPGF